MEPTEPQFMSAKKLRGLHLTAAQAQLNMNGGVKGQDNYQKTAKSVMAKKLRESKKDGLHDSIRESGVKNPVRITTNPLNSRTQLEDGHHRVASAMSIDPNMMIPIKRDEW